MSLWTVYCDGGARGQGSARTPIGACAVTIWRNGAKVGQYARGLGNRTNNECELEAILLALVICWVHPDIQDPTIYSDSLLAVNHVNGVWECHVAELVPLLVSVNEIAQMYRFRLIHAPRETVGDADALVNAFLDLLDDRPRPRRRRKKKPARS